METTLSRTYTDVSSTELQQLIPLYHTDQL